MKKLLIICLIVVCACGKNTETKDQHQHQANHAEHSHELSADGAEDTDCKHCGMPSEEFPKWQTILTNGDKKQYFCAPRCMFLTYLEDSTDLQNAKIEVNDYYDLELIDGKSAFYVIKSDVTGPMGHDLVAFKDKASAEEFMNDHKGEKILAFEEVNLQIIQELINC